MAIKLSQFTVIQDKWDAATDEEKIDIIEGGLFSLAMLQEGEKSNHPKLAQICRERLKDDRLIFGMRHKREIYQLFRNKGMNLSETIRLMAEMPELKHLRNRVSEMALSMTKMLEGYRRVLLLSAQIAFPDESLTDDINSPDLFDFLARHRPGWAGILESDEGDFIYLDVDVDIDAIRTQYGTDPGWATRKPAWLTDVNETGWIDRLGFVTLIDLLKIEVEQRAAEIKKRETDVEKREKAQEARQSRAPIGDLFAQRFIAIPNGTPCFDVSHAIAHKDLFKTDESGWPMARIERDESVTTILIKPDEARGRLSVEQEKFLQKQMVEHLEKMSDLDADVLDALMAIWIKTTRSPQGDSDAVAHIDDILELRHLKKKLGGAGRRGGYQDSQRAEHLEATFRLEKFWIEFDGAVTSGKGDREAITSRAIVITDMYGQRRIDGKIDVESILFRPGRIYGNYLMTEGRQTALLAARALQYDPYRQAPEKRLTRYLAWQWRIRSGSGNYLQSFKIDKLINEGNITITSNKPERAKQRLEDALDRLKEDAIINDWSYDGWDEAKESERRDRLPRGWWQRYIGANIKIEPPDAIPDHYAKLDRSRPTKQPATLKAGVSIGKQLSDTRKARRLSQAMTAEDLGITQAYLSQIERGKAKVSPTLKKKIEKWLSV